MTEIPHYLPPRRHLVMSMRMTPMASRLGDVLRTMGLPFEESLSGRWVKIQGQECAAYVVEGTWEYSYLTWCDRWDAREVERYPTPEEAIAAGLRRAGGQTAPDGHQQSGQRASP